MPRRLKKDYFLNIILKSWRIERKVLSLLLEYGKNIFLTP
jgi:hypothetical protein